MSTTATIPTPERPVRQTARRSPRHYLLPTVLDRLLDHEPEKSSEAPESYAMTSGQVRAVVQRDLTWLLNTTHLGHVLDEERYPEVASSVLNYGIPAFAGSFISERQWGEIERIIRRAIKDFEPRLLPGSVRVLPLVAQGEKTVYNVLHFEIHALLHMQPYPTEFMVQSSLDLETSRLTFK